MDPGTTRCLKHKAFLISTLGKAHPAIQGHLAGAERVELIAGGGSDRRFFRVAGPAGRVVFLLFPRDDREFDTYIAVARFLRSLGILAPEIYETYPQERTVVMEDLGDTSLYQILKGERSTEVLVSWYQKVLPVLATLQVEGRNQWQSCPEATRRTLDYSVLRWETAYFSSAFVEEYCSLDPRDFPGLDNEFDLLARRVAAEPLFFMHRDFQSQNIMVQHGPIRVIDFQGARKGLLQYDLAALLKDSYILLPRQAQQKLIDSYMNQLQDRGVAVCDTKQFEEIFSLAALQRCMQALGAFAFLSRTKGRTWFEHYIPAGLQHVRQLLENREDFPLLRSLVARLTDTIATG
jgi:hypothetical protein